MALLFFDGFETIKNNSEFSELYAVTNSSGSPPSVAGGRGRSAVALFGPDDQNFIRRDLGANYGTIIVGVALKRVAASEDLAVNQITLSDQAGGAQLAFRFTDVSGGTIIAANASNAIVATSSADAAVQGTDWFYFEVKVVIGNSGSIVARVNGVEVMNVSGVDTMSTVNANVRYVSLGTDRNHTGSSQFYYDDWYVCDDSGSVNNDFLGPVRVDPLYLDGEGTHDDFVASTGTDGSLLINRMEAGLDYIEGAVTGDKASFGIQPPTEITGDGTIFGVMVAAYSTGNARSMAGIVRSGSSEAAGSSTDITTAKAVVHVQGTDPATGALWTASALESAELGVEVTV